MNDQMTTNEVAVVNTEVTNAPALPAVVEVPEVKTTKMDGKKIAIVATFFTAVGIGVSIVAQKADKGIKKWVANGKTKRAEKKAAKTKEAETTEESTEETEE